MKRQLSLLLLSMATVLAGYYTYTNVISSGKVESNQTEKNKSVVKEKLEDNIINAKPSNIDSGDIVKSDEKNEPNIAAKPIEKASKEVAKKEVKKAVKKKKRKKKKTAIKPKFAAIEFDKTAVDFGEITSGDILDFEFEFTNTGKIPLDIIEAHATCGCATPTVPFISTMPGESNVIRVKYNSVNKEGSQSPVITIKTNTEPAIHQIKLTGNVLKKEDEEKEEDDEKTVKEEEVKEENQEEKTEEDKEVEPEVIDEKDSTIVPPKTTQRIKKSKSTKIGVKKDSIN